MKFLLQLQVLEDKGPFLTTKRMDILEAESVIELLSKFMLLILIINNELHEEKLNGIITDDDIPF